MAKRHVTTTINSEIAEFLCEPGATLLEVLRDQLGLTGTKEGCATGDCGACSVVLDGRVICSCLALAAEAEGAVIETIEGLASGEELHPLQQQFLEGAALQCGICTPGMLMSAVALLKKNPQPTEVQVEDALGGVLCRCTGHIKVKEAIRNITDYDK